MTGCFSFFLFRTEKFVRLEVAVRSHEIFTGINNGGWNMEMIGEKIDKDVWKSPNQCGKSCYFHLKRIRFILPPPKKTFFLLIINCRTRSEFLQVRTVTFIMIQICFNNFSLCISTWWHVKIAPNYSPSTCLSAFWWRSITLLG